jgi:hypothetical protein
MLVPYPKRANGNLWVPRPWVTPLVALIGVCSLAEQTIISWNPANWITVLIMVALGFTILGAIAKIYQQKKASS